MTVWAISTNEDISENTARESYNTSREDRTSRKECRPLVFDCRHPDSAYYIFPEASRTRQALR